MIFRIIFLTLFFSISSLFAGETNLIENITTHKDNHPNTRNTYEYNDDNLISEIIYKNFNGEWEISSRDRFEYNENNEIAVEYIDEWEANIWVQKRKTIFEYDENNKLVLKSHYQYVEDEWLKNQDIIYNYDEFGNLTEVIYGECFLNYCTQKRHTYTYDEKGNRLTETFEIYSENGYEYDRKNTYTYDDSGNVLSYLYQTWKDEDWENVIFQLYTYNNNNEYLTYMIKQWIKDDWVKSSLTEYFYNENGDLIRTLRSIWNESHELWQPKERHLYTYNDKGNITKELFQRLDQEWKEISKIEYIYDFHDRLISYRYHINEGENHTRRYYFYDAYGNYFSIYYYDRFDLSYHKTSNINYGSFSPAIRCFPNPITENATLKYFVAKPGNVSISMIDADGHERILMQENNSSQGYKTYFLDSSELPPGLYLIRIICNSEITSEKILILK